MEPSRKLQLTILMSDNNCCIPYHMHGAFEQVDKLLYAYCLGRYHDQLVASRLTTIVRCCTHGLPNRHVQ